MKVYHWIKYLLIIIFQVDLKQIEKVLHTGVHILINRRSNINVTVMDVYCIYRSECKTT